MKKLFFVSLVSLSSIAASAQSPVLTAPAGWCCGQMLVVSGAWVGPRGTPPPTFYSYDLIPCDQSGTPTGSPVFSSGAITATGGAPAGSYTFTNSWSYTTCGNYYLVKLGVTSNGTTWNYATQVSEYSTTPQPVISGSTTTCGSTQGYFCATNLVDPEAIDHWGYYNGGMQILGTSSCVNTPANYAGPLTLTYVNAYGCTGSTTVTITNYNTTPTFSAGVNASGSNFTIYANRSVSLPSGVSESWVVEEMTALSGGTVVPGTTATNANWNGMSGTVNFCDYTGVGGTITTCVNPSSVPSGKFYRITRTVTAPGCNQSYSVTVAACTGCRFGGSDESGIATGTNVANGFSVYPNPSNGQFQVMLDAPADNATAELVNLLGERVDAFTISGTSYNYSPAQTIAPGVYLLRITNNGAVSSQRIVIE